MFRKRRRSRSSPEVELNLAAMLDMAFQLLAFFILTFRPSAVEAQILLRMPPAQPVTQAKAETSPAPSVSSSGEAQVPSLVITLASNSDGQLGSIQLAGVEAGSLVGLRTRLAAILGTDSGFEQVLIQVDPALQYNELMKVIDICTQQKLASGESLSKLSLAEIGGSASSEAISP